MIIMSVCVCYVLWPSITAFFPLCRQTKSNACDKPIYSAFIPLPPLPLFRLLRLSNYFQCLGKIEIILCQSQGNTYAQTPQIHELMHIHYVFRKGKKSLYALYSFIVLCELFAQLYCENIHRELAIEILSVFLIHGEVFMLCARETQYVNYIQFRKRFIQL